MDWIDGGSSEDGLGVYIGLRREREMFGVLVLDIAIGLGLCVYECIVIEGSLKSKEQEERTWSYGIYTSVRIRLCRAAVL